MTAPATRILPWDDRSPSVEPAPRRSPLITWLAAPFDAVRRPLWRLSAKTAFGRACIRHRGLRLTTLALGHMAVALTLTVLAPVWLLLLGPLVLGVPHVASDIRYLLVRPPLPLGRRGLVLLLGPLLLMTFLRVLSTLGAPFYAELEIALGSAAMLGGVALAPRGNPRQKGLAFAVVLALTAVALLSPWTSLVIIAHVHNFVAFGLWLWLFRVEVSRRALFLIAGSYLAVLALPLSGALDGVLLDHASQGDVGHFGLIEMADTLAPGLELDLALRLVATYAFAQSLHYAIWLRLIPQRFDPRVAPPTFERSLARVRGDFGAIGFGLLVVLTLAIPAAALAFDAGQVRNVYLLAALAHGWLELGIIAALVARRGHGVSPQPAMPLTERP